MEGPPPSSRGRTKILEALRRSKQAEVQQPGAEPSAAPQLQQVVQPAAKAEVAAPRGRAALLAKFKQMQVSTPGGGGEPQATSEVRPQPVQQVTQTTTQVQAPKVQQVPVVVKEEPEKQACHFRGEMGTPIRVQANYIRIFTEKDKGVFEYEVRFNPEVDAKSARSKLITGQLPALGGVRTYDGGSCLYLPIRLPETHTVLTGEHPIDGSVVQISVIYKKRKLYSDCTHLFNVLFKRVMTALQFTRVGRNYFDPPNSKMIPQHRLEVLPGYVVSVDEFEGGLMLCLDTQHRVLRTSTVLDLMRDIHRSVRTENFKQEVVSQLIGSVVITKYNNQTYVVHDIIWNMTPNDSFETARGGSVTFADYYRTQHGLTITDFKQPLLLHVKKRKVPGTLDETEIKICLIPEFSYLTGLTDVMRNDFKVMKDVAAFTRLTPHQRSLSMRKYLDNVEKCPKASGILADWGLKIDGGLIDLEARVLNPETITFGENGKFTCDQKADWSGALGRNRVYGPVDVHDWGIVFLEKDQNISQEFGQGMERLGRTMGCNVSRPRYYPVKNDRSSTIADMCETAVSQGCKFLVFILQSVRDDLYSIIKKKTCVVYPIGSQVIQARNLYNQKKVRTIMLKIALQINCKLGGSLWALTFPCKTWMVCGIDVYHSKGSQMSVAAIVSTLDNKFTRYYTSVVMQEKELIDALRVGFTKSLMRWHERTGAFPTHVVIFRDGVGDGQIEHVRQYELEQFQAATAELGIGKIDICLVVIQKRINTRIFAPDMSTGNPVPGTVLDRDVTRRFYQDFFLIPQHVTQGTVSPTHYIIVHNSANLKPDHVQKLAFKMCHLYYNWSGTIRVPAPCQYAHKVAYLVGQHIQALPSNDAFGERLWYL